MSEYPTTDNHDFARPEPGTLGDEWGTVINEDLIDRLEERVTVRDVEANRTDYTPHENVRFVATDTGAVYDGDGEDWRAADRRFATGEFADVTTERFNTVVHVQPGEELTAAVADRASGDVLVELPAGVIEYDDSLDYADGDLTIVGHGQGATTLRADGVERFWASFSDRSDVEMTLRELTIDANHVESVGRVFQFAGPMGGLHLDSVTLKNVDISAHDGGGRSSVVMCLDEIGHIVATGSTVFRADTFTGKDLGDSTATRFAMVDADRADAEIERMVCASTVSHVGHLHELVMGGEDFLFQGWRGNVSGSMIVDGSFLDWDQYAFWGRAADPTATFAFRGHVTRGGDGDLVRAMGYDANGGGTFHFGGSISYQNPEASNIAGDRGYLTHSDPVDVVTLDCAIANGYVPVEIRGARAVMGEMTAYDSGSPVSVGDGRHTALQITDADGEIGKVNVRVNVFNETAERGLDPAIWLQNRNEGGWKDGTLVLEGTVEGYEETLVDDGTPAGVTVDTDRLFDDGPF